MEAPTRYRSIGCLRLVFVAIEGLDSLLVFGVSAAQGNFFNLLIHSARPTTHSPLDQPSHPHPSNNGAPTLNCKSKLLQFRFHVFLFFCFWVLCSYSSEVFAITEAERELLSLIEGGFLDSRA